MAILNHNLRHPVGKAENRSRKSAVRPLTTGLILALLLGLRCLAQEAPLPESQVKAAFLVNFPKYVEWPAEAFPATNSPFVLAVLGETDVLVPLTKMIQSRTFQGRSIVIRRITTDEKNLTDCHILFISNAERRHASALLEKLKGQSILTVGESEQFVEKGGLINLTRRDQKVRLDINLNAARAARLQISSKLLNVADVVKGKAE